VIPAPSFGTREKEMPASFRLTARRAETFQESESFSDLPLALAVLPSLSHSGQTQPRNFQSGGLGGTTRPRSVVYVAPVTKWFNRASSPMSSLRRSISGFKPVSVR
jgi:hypothetical protein